jgi:hypothetical protein
MSVTESDLTPTRLKAPAQDGVAVFWPPLSAAAELVERNLALRETHCDCQARRELLQAAIAYTSAYRDVGRLAPSQEPGQDSLSPSAPILLAGHQPQLFHPGVWVKNFVLSRLGEQFGAWPVNLVIDNDICRQTAIRVPAGSPESPRIESVPLDQPSAEIPYEERAVLDFEVFSSFGRRVAETIRPLVADALVSDLWPRAVEAARRSGGNLGRALAEARHKLEGDWGAATLELPLSSVCQTESFRRFFLSMAQDLERFRRVYNEALAEYRRAYHLRSRSHPAPDLAADAAWLEAPFWIWSKSDPRRRRLFVRRRGEDLELTDRANLQITLAGALSNDDRGVEQLSEVDGALARVGAKIRSRALITTMYARLTLGDLFLHGIGGAKYDELTDVIIRRYFHREPAAYMAASATVLLPVSRPNATADDLRRIAQQLRELRFHPEHYLEGDIDGEVRSLVEDKRHWIGESAPHRLAERHRQINRINHVLQPHVERQRQRLLAERQDLSDALRRAKLLGSRDFAFCLYPEATLRPVIRRLTQQIG